MNRAAGALTSPDQDAAEALIWHPDACWGQALSTSDIQPLDTLLDDDRTLSLPDRWQGQANRARAGTLAAGAAGQPRPPAAGAA